MKRHRLGLTLPLILLSGLLVALPAQAQELFVSSVFTDQVLRYNGTTGAFIDAFVTAGSGGLNGPVFLVFRSSAGIPTLSEWAQIGMVALLVLGGLLALRRRSGCALSLSK